MYLTKQRATQINQCKQIYEIYRRQFGVVKSLALTKTKVCDLLILSEREARSILEEMWTGHPRLMENNE